MIIRNNLIWDTTQNIYLSGEAFYIRNVQILGNVVWAKNNPNLGKGTEHRAERGGHHEPADRRQHVRVRGDEPDHGCLCPEFQQLHLGPDAAQQHLLHVRRVDEPAQPGRRSTTTSTTTRATGTWCTGTAQAYSSLAALRAADPTHNQNSMQVDPLFVNPAARDFRLQAGSPAINKGVPVAGLTSDFDGTARPLGGAYDIGGFEKQ